MKPDFFGKNLFQLSYDKLEKGKKVVLAAMIKGQ